MASGRPGGGLLEADCGGANPLMKLSTHVIGDAARSQEGLRDRVGGPSGGGGGDRFHTDNQFVSEFLADSRRQLAPQTFNMSGLLEEMRHMDGVEVSSRAAPQRAPPVSLLTSQAQWGDNSLLRNHSEQGTAAGLFSRDFDELSAAPPPPGATLAGGLAQRVSTQPAQFHRPSQQWMPPMSLTNDPQTLTPPPKAWTMEFKEKSSERGSEDELVRTAREMSASVDDPRLKETTFMKFVTDIGREAVVIKDGQVTGESMTSSYAQIEQQDEPIRNVASVSPSSKVTDWVNQFTQEESKPAEGIDNRSLTDKWSEELLGEESAPNEDFWASLQKQWDDDADTSGGGSHPWLADYDATKPYKNYNFEESNPLKDHPDPFKEGMERLAKGDIPNAVLLFETAVQKDESHMEAWQFLGTCQAENEQEPQAIAALIKCLELEPSNRTALYALAASYTNEHLEVQACDTLIDWIRQSPQYADLAPPVTSAESRRTSSYMTTEMHKGVCDMYLKAVRRSANTMDPLLQSGLGVLFNLSGEFDKAVDCFKAALQVNPQDAMLWNRLGATLANGKRSEEAVESYRNALSLAPGYIRARYNLGIACINLKAHQEAATYFLEALTQQKASQGPRGERSVMSDTIWSTFRMTLSMMGKTELLPFCEARDLSALKSRLEIQ